MMMPKLRAEKIVEPVVEWLGNLPTYTPTNGGPSGSAASCEDLVRVREVLDGVIDEIVKFGSDMFNRGFQHANKLFQTGVEFGSHLEAAILKALEPLTYSSVMDASGDAVDRTLKNVAVLIHDYERNAFDRGVAASVSRTVGYPHTSRVEVVPPIAIEIHGLDPAVYRLDAILGFGPCEHSRIICGTSNLSARQTMPAIRVIDVREGTSREHRFTTAEERDREYADLVMMLKKPAIYASYDQKRVD